MRTSIALALTLTAALLLPESGRADVVMTCSCDGSAPITKTCPSDQTAKCGCSFTGKPKAHCKVKKDAKEKKGNKKSK